MIFHEPRRMRPEPAGDISATQGDAFEFFARNRAGIFLPVAAARGRRNDLDNLAVDLRRHADGGIRWQCRLEAQAPDACERQVDRPPVRGRDRGLVPGPFSFHDHGIPLAGEPDGSGGEFCRGFVRQPAVENREATVVKRLQHPFPVIHVPGRGLFLPADPAETQDRWRSEALFALKRDSRKLRPVRLAPAAEDVFFELKPVPAHPLDAEGHPIAVVGIGAGQEYLDPGAGHARGMHLDRQGSIVGGRRRQFRPAYLPALCHFPAPRRPAVPLDRGIALHRS